MDTLPTWLLIFCLLIGGFRPGYASALNVAESPPGSGHGGESENAIAEEKAFETILNAVESTIMDKNAMSKMLELFNESCLTSDQVFMYLEISPNDTVSESQFLTVLPLIISKIKNATHCNSSFAASNRAPIASINIVNLFKPQLVCRSHLSALINDIIKAGKFTPNPGAKKCFSAFTLLPERCTSNVAAIREALMQLIASIARSDCLLPDPSYFLEEVEEFLKRNTGKIDVEGLSELFSKLKLGGEDFATEKKVESTIDDVKEQGGSDVIVVGKDRHRRSAEDEGESRCYSTNEMVSIFDLNTTFSLESFTRICPALIQQLMSGACESDDHHDEAKTTESAASSYTTAQRYGYGTVSVLLISMLAFGGLLLFPNMNSRWYKIVMQFFIALGVGTLSGDALLHLIPEVVGLHKHDEEGEGGHDDDHGDEEKDENAYIWRILVVVAGIYVFYLFENSLRLWNQLRGTNITFHVHDDEDGSHHHHHDNKKSHNHGEMHMTTAAVIANSNSDDCDVDKKISLPHKKPIESRPSQVPLTIDEDEAPRETICCGVTPIGIMVLVGDALHNFGDGIALGVAFSSSWVGGVGASIAIFCHELPHEFGDFAIYMKNGMSKWMALGFNFLAACCAFIGLYIGLSVAENPSVREWMLAVIAGMFLYIALVDVMHEMVEERTDTPLLQFAVQNIGMCLGWAILLLLALYEDDIKVALGG